MDATRARRTRDRARQGWYAGYRQVRFARYLGFAGGLEVSLFRVTAGRAPIKPLSTIGPRLGHAALVAEAAVPAASGLACSLSLAAQ